MAQYGYYGYPPVAQPAPYPYPYGQAVMVNPAPGEFFLGGYPPAGYVAVPVPVIAIVSPGTRFRRRGALQHRCYRAYQAPGTKSWHRNTPS